MKYACLIYDEEKKLEKLSQDESQAFMKDYFAFTENIKKSGHYVAGEALQPIGSATSLRFRNGKLSTTDGPFMETKEQLGGFYLIDARDLNEALQIAARIPSVKTGTIEVRPVQDFSQAKEMQAAGRQAARELAAADKVRNVPVETTTWRARLRPIEAAARTTRRRRCRPRTGTANRRDHGRRATRG